MSEVIGAISEFNQRGERSKEIGRRIGALIIKGGGYQAFPDMPRVAYRIPTTPSITNIWLIDNLGRPIPEIEDIEGGLISIPGSIINEGGWFSIAFEHEPQVPTPYGLLPSYILDQDGNLWSFDTTYFFNQAKGLAFEIQTVFDFDKSEVGRSKRQVVEELKEKQKGGLTTIDHRISTDDSRLQPLTEDDYLKIETALSRIETGTNVELYVPKPPATLQS